MNKGTRINVLDRGFVELVNFMGDDNEPLVAARLSTGNPTGVDEKKDDGLRNRLWKDQHTSPFEMAELAIKVKLPLAILRQLERHRTMDLVDGLVIETNDEDTRKFLNRNEFSGRYSQMPDEFYIPTPDRILGKDPNNKQGSQGPLPWETQITFVEKLEEYSREGRYHYEWAVQSGVANELARFFLPPNQYTLIMLKGDLLAFFKLLRLRLPPDVQWEARQYANAIADIVKALFPKSWAVFEEHTLNARTFSATEIEVLREALVGHNPNDLMGVLGPNYISIVKKLGL